MSPAIKTALVLTMIWAIIKMVLFMLNMSDLGADVGRLSMFLFIIIATGLGLWRKYRTVKKEDSDTLSDLSDAAKSGFFYVIFACIFMFVYYQFIDSNYLNDRADRLIKEKTEWIMVDENYEFIMEQVGEAKQMSREELIEQESGSIRKFHSMQMIVGMGFVVWVLITMISSLVVTLLFRHVLLK